MRARRIASPTYAEAPSCFGVTRSVTVPNFTVSGPREERLHRSGRRGRRQAADEHLAGDGDARGDRRRTRDGRGRCRRRRSRASWSWSSAEAAARSSSCRSSSSPYRSAVADGVAASRAAESTPAAAHATNRANVSPRRLTAASVATPPKISGSFEITASTPAASSRASSAESSTVQAQTAAPARVRALDGRRGHDGVMEHQRGRPGALDHARDARNERAAQRQRSEPDRRLERPAAARRRTGPPGYVKPIGIRGARAGEGGEAREVERADDGALGQPVPHEPVGDLVEARRQLQVDVEADVARRPGTRAPRRASAAPGRPRAARRASARERCPPRRRD